MLKDPVGTQVLEHLSAAAGSVGTPDFQFCLLTLARALLPHDFHLALRYSRKAPPSILKVEGISCEVMQAYKSGLYLDDPFYEFCCNHNNQGVLALTGIATSRDRPYYKDYLYPKAKISDEVGILLPSIGDSYIGVFVERTTGEYSRKYTERLKRLYPLIANLNRAHLSQLIANIKSTAAEQAGTNCFSLIVITDDDTVILEDTHRGANDEALSDLRKNLQLLRRNNRTSLVLSSGEILRRIILDDVTTHGMGVEVYSVEAHPQPTTPYDTPKHVWSSLTRRETEIVKLVLSGFPNALIADRLGLSLGTVKNYRSRLYYKLDITTERELVMLLTGR